MNGGICPENHYIEMLIKSAEKQGVNLHIPEYIYDHAEMFTRWRDIVEGRIEETDCFIDKTKVFKAAVEVEKYITGRSLEQDCIGEYSGATKLVKK